MSVMINIKHEAVRRKLASCKIHAYTELHEVTRRDTLGEGVSLSVKGEVLKHCDDRGTYYHLRGSGLTFVNPKPHKKPSIKKFFIDMDGVLVDLLRSLALKNGFEDVYKFALQGRDITLELDRALEGGVYAGALPMPHANDIDEMAWALRLMGYEVKILTSVLKKAKSPNVVKMQKLEWVRKNLTHLKPDDVVFANGSSGKQEFLTRETLLIDDYEKTIQKCKGRGIPCIQYKNYPELQELVKIVVNDPARFRREFC